VLEGKLLEGRETHDESNNGGKDEGRGRLKGG